MPEVASIETPEQAMTHLDAHRVRGLTVGQTVASLLTAAMVMALGGDWLATSIHAAALVASALVTGAYAIAFRDPTRYKPTLAFVVMMSTIPVMLTGFYYWGVFSAYAAVVPLTIFIATDAATSSRQALLGAAVAVLTHTALGLVIIVGWVDSRGVVDTVRGTQTTQIVALALIAMLTIGAALIAHDIRRRTRAVFDEHNRAQRVLAQREAQVFEAQAEAAEARKAAHAGKPGRFTDQQIDGFTLGEVLGRGAMGEVYAARRDADGLQCAMKLLAPHLLRNPNAFDRFRRETAMLLALESPNVVRVLAVSTSTAALPYVAMERLVGIDLAELLKEQQIVPLPAVVEIITQVSRGLDVAHRAGVIHRDLKPQNLFAIGPATSRTWKIIDFGVAKWIDSEGSLTKDMIIGTPGYMAPEQALGRAVDARSDVYSLGVIVYRMVTGIPAVNVGDVPKMLHEVVYKLPPRPASITDVPPQVEAMLALALAKRVEDRFQSASELASALDDAVAGRLSANLALRASRIITDHRWGTWIQS
jgi:eukaryotic-like serine/threonine-protein kinase